jgi:hypothetical protein
MAHEEEDDHAQRTPPIGYTMFPVPRDRLLRTHAPDPTSPPDLEDLRVHGRMTRRTLGWLWVLVACLGLTITALLWLAVTLLQSLVGR